MTIHISIIPGETTGGELRAVRALVNELLGESPAEVVPDSPTTEVKPPAKAAPKAAAPKAAPAPKAEEPQPAAEDEDVLGTAEPTMEDAVIKATEQVQAGKTAKVKEALTAVGAKRVSELKGAEQIAGFIEALAS